jgi:NAD(P)H-flavin reductase
MSTPRKLQCTVERITDHGDGVYTVEMKPLRPVPVFRPGQFLHLTLDNYDPSGFWPESRVFSIASSPGARECLRIVYSVKGVYTTRMAKELHPGKGVWVKMPYGEFVVDGTADAVLIAGGTGITAFQAFIEGLGPEHPHKVVLLYGARRPDLLLGREMIEKKERTLGTFRACFFSEMEVPRLPPAANPYPAPGVDSTAAVSIPQGTTVPAVSDHSAVTILPGKTNLDILKGCAMSDSGVYYLAGPPSMVAAFQLDLEQGGVARANIRVDAWE